MSVPAILHLVEPGTLQEHPVHLEPPLLANRFRVARLDMNELESLPVMLEQLKSDTFNLLATGRASRAALALAREMGPRVLALALESPEAPGDETPDTPTLVLLGTRDDSGTAAAGRACAERIPGAHLVFVYDAGRAISHDRPEAFAEVVGDFFERHDAFVINRATTVIHP